MRKGEPTMDNLLDDDIRGFFAKTERQKKTINADTKKRMEEVRNRLRKKARKEERQQIIEDIFADNSDNDDNSETAIVSSIADNILDD